MSGNISKKVLVEINQKNDQAIAAIAALAKEYAKLKDITLTAKVSVSEFTSEIAKSKLEQQQAKTAIDQKKLSLLEESAAQKKATAAVKEAKAAQTAANGSYDEAQKRLTALGRAIKSAEGGFKSTSPAIQKQIKEYNDLNVKLKAFDVQLGNHQREVGHYENALNGLNAHLKNLAGSLFDLVPGMNVFSGALSNAVQTFNAMSSSVEKILKDQATLTKAASVAQEEAAVAAKADAIAQEQLAAGEISAAEATVIHNASTEAQIIAQKAATVATEGTSVALRILKLALASTGIGLLLVALGSLIAYFTETNEGSKKVKVAIAEVSAVFNALMKQLAPLGKAIYDTFANSEGPIRFVAGWLGQCVWPLSTIVRLVGDLAHGEFKQAFEDAGTALKQFYTNLKNIGLGAGETVIALGKNTYEASKKINISFEKLKEAAQAAGELTVANQKLTKAEREWSEVKIKQQGQVQLLTKKLRDQGLSEEERIKLAEKAKSIRQNIYEIDMEHANENLRIITAQQELNSKKDYQAITDAKNRISETTNAYNNEVQNIDNRESRLAKNRERAAAKAQEDLAAARAGISQASNERQVSIAKMLQDQMDELAKELSITDEAYRQKLFKEEQFRTKMEQAKSKAKDAGAKSLFQKAIDTSNNNEAQEQAEHGANKLKIIDDYHEKTYQSILKADLQIKQLQNESQENELKKQIESEDLKLSATLNGLEKEKEALNSSIAKNSESVKTAKGDELAAIQQTLDRQKILLKANSIGQEAETKASEQRKAKIKEDAAHAALMAQDKADVLANKSKDGNTSSTEHEAEKKEIQDTYAFDIAEAAKAGKSTVLLKQEELAAIEALEDNYRAQKFDKAVVKEKMIQDTSVSIISNALSHQAQATQVALDKSKAHELKNTALTGTQKELIEEKYRVKAGQAKVKEFKANQKLQIANALINLMVAEGRLWVDPGFPAAIPLAIELGAQGAAQIGIIANQKPPAYATGDLHYSSDGRGSLLKGPGTGTSDSMNAYVSNGESIINAKSTSMFAPLLSAINQAGGGKSFGVNMPSSPWITPGFASGGSFNTYSPTADNGLRPIPIAQSGPIRMHADDIASIGNHIGMNFPAVYVDVKDVNNQQNILSSNQARVII